MTNAMSPASTLHQMARLADELESQGAEIIGASLGVGGPYMQLSAYDLPAAIAERGTQRKPSGSYDIYDEIFYDASGVRVCWLVNRETSND